VYGGLEKKRRIWLIRDYEEINQTGENVTMKKNTVITLKNRAENIGSGLNKRHT